MHCQSTCTDVPLALRLQVFLYGCENPTVLLLYQDPKEMRHLKAYEARARPPARSRAFSQIRLPW
jgi:hypothetical protein